MTDKKNYYICDMKKMTDNPDFKWERVYEDDYTTSIWRYNSKISLINPYEVEVKHKKDPVTEVKKPRSKKK